MTPLDAAKKLTAFFKNLGVHFVFDTTFARNFSLLESQWEFVQRFQRRAEDKKALPMLAAACPASNTTEEASRKRSKNVVFFLKKTTTKNQSGCLFKIKTTLDTPRIIEDHQNYHRSIKKDVLELI